MRLELEIPEVALAQPAWVYWTAGVIAYLLVGIVVGRWVYRDFCKRDAERDGGMYDAEKNDSMNIASGFVLGLAGWPVIAVGLTVLLPIHFGSWLITVGNGCRLPSPAAASSPREDKAWDPAGEDRA